MAFQRGPPSPQRYADRSGHAPDTICSWEQERSVFAPTGCPGRWPPSTSAANKETLCAHRVPPKCLHPAAASYHKPNPRNGPASSTDHKIWAPHFSSNILYLLRTDFTVFTYHIIEEARLESLMRPLPTTQSSNSTKKIIAAFTARLSFFSASF